jgi:hypothetical protein
MGPLTDAEMQQRLAASAQVKEYATPVDRESARELLAARMSGDAAGAGGSPKGVAGDEAAAPLAIPAAATATIGALAAALNSPIVKTIASRATTQVMRGLMGALLGPPPRRSRRY